MTDEYPAKLACELRASIFWALVILGTNSMLIADIFFSLIFFTRTFSLKGSKKLINKVPGLILSISSSCKFLTEHMRLASKNPSSRETIFTPIAAKSSSEVPMCSEKDFSIKILRPNFKNFSAVSKVKETLFSISGSLGKKIFI